MKLLIVTQAVDLDDPVLGFFHRWIEELAKRFESIEVVCLQKGRYHLPANVRVHSLGKECGRPRFIPRLVYAVRFLKIVWHLRHDYDAVFIHMNEEYVLIGGLLWRSIGKQVYLWRNYHGGSFRTDTAMALCTKIFCTSRYSYTAKNKKTDIMPVGVDTEQFFPDALVPRIPHSVLFLSGMWPSKHPEVLIEALTIVHKKEIAYTADFYGSPLPQTEAYYASLKKQVADAGLAQEIIFHPSIPNNATPDLYRAHEIFVNCSPSGMYDKTIFEAAASGCLVLASSRDFAQITDSRCVFPEYDANILATHLEMLFALPEIEKENLRKQLQQRASADHSLVVLAQRLVEAIH